jgi:hypothetical protein
LTIAGVTSSLKNIFTPSTSVCSAPSGPTRFGPRRDCMRATTRRSAQMSTAVVSRKYAKTIRTVAARPRADGSCADLHHRVAPGRARDLRERDVHRPVSSASAVTNGDVELRGRTTTPGSTSSATTAGSSMAPVTPPAAAATRPVSPSAMPCATASRRAIVTLAARAVASRSSAPASIVPRSSSSDRTTATQRTGRSVGRASGAVGTCDDGHGVRRRAHAERVHLRADRVEAARAEVAAEGGGELHEHLPVVLRELRGRRRRG